MTWVYNDSLPERVKTFGRTFCKLSKAPFAGKPIEFIPYQDSLINELYGWQDQQTTRLKHKLASIWLPKKQGKSSLCSVLALWNLVWKPGNEVYIIAPTVKQAGCVFEEAAAMVEQCRALDSRKGGRLWVRRNLKRIEDTKRFSKLEVLSCSPEISGFNAGLIIYDELAEFPKCHAQAVLDKTANACDAREDGHKIIISTAQFDKEHPGYHAYTLAKQCLNKEIDRPDILPVIYEVDEHADWRDPEQWRKSNPAAEKIFPFKTIEDDYNSIVASPIEEARFRTLRLNQWVGSTIQWIASDKWAACGEQLDESTLHGLPAFIGIDYARKYDLCAYVILVVLDGLYYLLPRFFIPEQMAAKKQKIDNVPYLRAWARDPNCKLHLTDGDVVHPSFMRAKIKEDCERFKIQEIGFDPYGLEESRQILEAEGLTITEQSQKPSAISPAVQHFERLVIQGKIRHPNNPILNWNLGNCVVKPIGATDSITIDKAKSNQRIDGIVASYIALARQMATEEWYDSPVLWI